MGARTTWFLLVVVLGLGALLWFTDRQPPARNAAEIGALDGRSLGDCRRLRWQVRNLQPVEIGRGADGAFWMQEPIVDLASMAHLRQIVNAWDSARLLATEYQDDDEGRRETGLLPPEIVFTIEWPTGPVLKLELGAPGPLGTDRFVRRDGRIWRGGTGLYESMRVGIDDLRERAVFRTTEPQCTELRVDQRLPSGKREVLHLQRAGGREWRMAAPYQGRTEAATAVQFVTAVLALRADQFLPGVVRPREGEPGVRVLVRGAFGEESLDLWDEQGIGYGLLPGRKAWFQSDHRPYAAVFVNAADHLRAKVLVPFANVAQELAEVVIDPGQGRGERVHLVRDTEAAAWRLTEPVAFAAHPSPCAELVQAINNLRAVEFADGSTAAEPRFGLGSDRLLVAVRGFERQEVTNLWLGADAGRPDAPLCWACRADEPDTVVLVPAPAVEQLRKAWTAYCARDVLRIAVPVERLELRRRGEQAPRVFRADGDHWVLEGAPGPRDEVRDVANDVLRDLRGAAAVDQRTAGEPDWTLTMCRANQDVLLALRVWDRGADRPLIVQRTDEPVVGFELSSLDGKNLRELWR